MKYLSALRGTIKFDLENRVDDDAEDVCDMDARYYQLFESDGDDIDGEKRRVSLLSEISVTLLSSYLQVVFSAN